MLCGALWCEHLAVQLKVSAKCQSSPEYTNHPPCPTLCFVSKLWQVQAFLALARSFTGNGVTQRQALIPKLTKRTGIHRAAVAGIPSLGHCSTFIISTQQKPRMTHRQCNPQSVGRVWARLGFPRTLFGSVRAHGFSAESSLGSSRQPVQLSTYPGGSYQPNPTAATIWSFLPDTGHSDANWQLLPATA